MSRCCTSMLFLLGILLPLGCGQKPPASAALPAPTVGFATPLAKDVVNYEDFSGQTDAVESVDIRARVSGYLTKVCFQDGDVVKEGAPLFEIDPRPFEDDLAQAQGVLEQLNAQKKLLQIQVDRYQNLANKGAGSQQDLDQYLAQQAENVGNINAALAQVAHARLNLDFTKIASPIAGRLSRTMYTRGNLINADTTLLTTVVSIDPMYAGFNIDEPTLLRIRKMIREGVLKVSDAKEVVLHMGLTDDKQREFPFRGTFCFSNNVVDSSTGTIFVRGRFPNEYQMPENPPVLMPGMFVRVRLPVSPLHPVLLINERAICADQGKKFVYVLDAKNKVNYREVKLGLLFDGLQAIEEGLQSDDRVVVNNLQRIRQDMVVVPEEVRMNDLRGVTNKPATP